MERKKQTRTLCWSCQKACNKCVWSKYFLPIVGWDAEPTTISQTDNGRVRTVHSYFVKGCPQYQYDGEDKVMTQKERAAMQGISVRTLQRKNNKEQIYDRTVL